MIRYRESEISAFHNYMVNGALVRGFSVGDPGSRLDAYFEAYPVLPGGDVLPCISARILDGRGRTVVELSRNRICNHTTRWGWEAIPGGFRIADPPNDSLLQVRTQQFANGYLTRIQTRLLDRNGSLLMEPLGESIQIHGQYRLIGENPGCPGN